MSRIGTKNHVALTAGHAARSSSSRRVYRRPFLMATSLFLLSGLLEGCGSGYITLSQNTVSVQTDTTPPGALNVKSPPYLAHGDGKTDDTASIRRAVGEACASGGGVIYFPVGIYIISPQEPSERGALIIPCDNVTLQGEGKGLSILSRLAYQDTDPDAVCPTYAGQVNRGAGVYVTAKENSDGTRRSFHMSKITLTGNRVQFTGVKGSNISPASVGNCYDVWDISDKGLYIQQDHDSSDISLDSVEISYFSGELVYGGSTNSTDWTVKSSELHHSNGDAISVSAGLTLTNTTMHDLGANGVENQPYGTAEPQLIINNIVYNTRLDGIGLMTYDPSFYSAPVPVIEVAANTISFSQRFGVTLLAVRGGNVHDNFVYDSGTNLGTACGIALVGYEASGASEIPQQISITSNTIEARSTTVQCGIQVYSPFGGVPARDVIISANSLGPTQPTNSAARLLQPISVAAGAQDVTVVGNILH